MRKRGELQAQRESGCASATQERGGANARPRRAHPSPCGLLVAKWPRIGVLARNASTRARSPVRHLGIHPPLSPFSHEKRRNPCQNADPRPKKTAARCTPEGNAPASPLSPGRPTARPDGGERRTPVETIRRVSAGVRRKKTQTRARKGGCGEDRTVSTQPLAAAPPSAHGRRRPHQASVKSWRQSSSSLCATGAGSLEWNR